MSNNPLLAAVRIPGQTFRLPSRGLFYTNGELDDTVGTDGEVVVNPMRTTEELTLNNPDKLFTGDAVVEIFKHCVPQVIKARELLSQDVDYLMMCVRVVTYGEMLTAPYIHTCENAEEHEYQINQNQIIKQAKEIDPTTIKTKFKLELENGQVLTLRPPRFDRVIKLYQTLSGSDELGDEDVKETVFANLTDMISEVDEVSDSEMIMEWLRELPAGFVGKINDFVAKSSDWGVNPEVTIQCKDCGQDMLVSVPTNPINFFT